MLTDGVHAFCYNRDTLPKETNANLYNGAYDTFCIFYEGKWMRLYAFSVRIVVDQDNNECTVYSTSLGELIFVCAGDLSYALFKPVDPVVTHGHIKRFFWICLERSTTAPHRMAYFDFDATEDCSCGAYMHDSITTARCCSCYKQIECTFETGRCGLCKDEISDYNQMCGKYDCKRQGYLFCGDLVCWTRDVDMSQLYMREEYRVSLRSHTVVSDDKPNKEQKCVYVSEPCKTRILHGRVSGQNVVVQ